MLSELCVRRPVMATMLVMSLVVLGIFSFRELGVDLFPRAELRWLPVVAALLIIGDVVTQRYLSYNDSGWNAAACG